MEYSAEVSMRSETEGGRSKLKLFDGYRPHIKIGDGELLGIVFHSVPSSVPANTTVEVKFRQSYPGAVDYSGIVVGVEFTIVEGARVVGGGLVTAT